jgi:hypothetical protein
MICTSCARLLDHKESFVTGRRPGSKFCGNCFKKQFPDDYARLTQPFGKDEKKTREEHLGIRHDNGKHDWSLVPMQHLEGMVRVLEFGKKKYAAHNWRKGLHYSRITNSLQRHLNAFNAGEDIDKESGLRHIDHILCNALFLAGMAAEHPEMDDRYKITEAPST